MRTQLIKSIITSNLMPFRTQLKLTTYLSNNNKNFFKLLLPIEIIICLYNEPLVVMLIYSLEMLELFSLVNFLYLFIRKFEKVLLEFENILNTGRWDLGVSVYSRERLVSRFIIARFIMRFLKIFPVVDLIDRTL